jgi:hypothetical protein
MSRQQRRAAERATAKAETRRQQFDRIHGQVLAGQTIRDMWLIYGRERFEPGVPLDSPEATEILEPTFYAGFASALQLMLRVSPDDVSDEVGAEMLSRLHEELHVYSLRAKGRGGS